MHYDDQHSNLYSTPGNEDNVKTHLQKVMAKRIYNYKLVFISKKRATQKKIDDTHILRKAIKILSDLRFKLNKLKIIISSDAVIM